MANGKLGALSLLATTNASVYTVPAATVATFNVNMVNKTSASIRVRLSIGSSTPVAADYIEYDSTIPAYGVLERTGLMASENEVLVAYADAVGVSIRVYGYEE